ncbi:SAVED domain-containing protein [Acidovorax sp. SRB_14]|uniref:SAVED domain-containing protein n=1 Tax=Acidovorax sp. SRB_14 TaxID=1962699 RepID=UPI0015651B51|nr:SAVED domain-containing protein [Acidovorax sp. SRB_14]
MWIAAAGRCEFRGCNQPVGRDFLTKARCNVGEYAHIVADSPDGPRGILGESERLAKDASNLMLACFGCHSRIDRHGQNNEFTAEQLSAMKREHEARIERIYSAVGTRDSLLILMTFPIAEHKPTITLGQVHYAMLQNSDYTLFPGADHVFIDKSDFDIQDNDPDFWARAETALGQLFDRRIQPAIEAKNGAAHLTIAAFAPIPMLMKLGTLLGDKTEASILDLPGDQWLWDRRLDCPAPKFTYTVPDKLPREVAVMVNISNIAQVPTDMNTVEFTAVEPNRGIIRTEAHMLDFRREFNAFLLNLHRSGARVIHLHPTTPLSASVEIGRLLLPKVFEEVHVWEWRAPSWRPALRLR